MSGALTFTVGTVLRIRCQHRPIRALAQHTTTRTRTVDAVNLYQILRVKETASPVEIKAAYRRLAKRYHPDVMSGFDDDDDEGRGFMEIQNAYATLSDPMTRACYDLTITKGRRYKAACVLGSGRGRTMSTTRRWETDQCW
ncbi:PREDICTED: chaperone protein dnaJ 11, chloroplastic-like [Nelumbo nucifera]|uniref:J domain-containing protein n=2 Tax=Nelumbo nucifera TaxID=4432 RepID=A0A822XVM8_NELNU|nr:PREDICTED: chaperone protein dnaJ 11, chloroplastic-like [Nelumbo nucifera]DAD23803.1 TPA_asm: hypothetical protein HUJ06_025266 [Nelumbo nucifera]